MPKPDLSEFYEEEKKECIATRLISKLSPDDKINCLAAMDDKNINSMKIVRYLQKRGIDAKHPAILRHRSKDCICDK